MTNPVTGEQIPMFVADYVLMEYGTGAIMAVPAHDQRDYDFAVAFGLPIRQVVAPGDGTTTPAPDEAFVSHTEDEHSSTPGEFSGMNAVEGQRAIVAWLDREGTGHSSVNSGCATGCLAPALLGLPDPDRLLRATAAWSPVPEEELPVELPEVEDYQPQGTLAAGRRRGLGQHHLPECGGPAKRETDTMDTFVDSSWYFLRYCDARNDEAAWDREVLAQLDARRPVHRRRRARDPAPDVRALLRQGARGHGPGGRPGAVPARCSPRG